MDQAQLARFRSLRQEWITFDAATDIVGADPGPLDERLQAYSRLIRPSREPVRGNLVSRWVFEGCLQHYGVLPKPIAALRLGMTVDSLTKALDALEAQGLIVRNTRDWPDDVVDAAIIKTFHSFIPSLRYQIFADHSTYCRDVHAALAREFQVVVTAVYCSTSEMLNEAPADLAYDRCCISQLATGLRHKVTMNFGKPLRLPPDVCARRFYAVEAGELAGFVLGTPPLIDDVLAVGA